MSYKIVIDSCGELLEQWKQDERFASVPLTLTVGSENIIDDETFNQADFLQKVAACPECPKSACPSPESYRKAFDCEAEHIYCVLFPLNSVVPITVQCMEQVFFMRRKKAFRFMFSIPVLLLSGRL